MADTTIHGRRATRPGSISLLLGAQVTTTSTAMLAAGATPRLGSRTAGRQPAVPEEETAGRKVSVPDDDHPHPNTHQANDLES